MTSLNFPITPSIIALVFSRMPPKLVAHAAASAPTTAITANTGALTPPSAITSAFSAVLTSPTAIFIDPNTLAAPAIASSAGPMAAATTANAEATASTIGFKFAIQLIRSVTFCTNGVTKFWISGSPTLM